MTHYTTITDARTALENSGVYEFFEDHQIDEAAEYMFRNDATPEQAADHILSLDDADRRAIGLQ